jgi:hypothetical protein
VERHPHLGPETPGSGLCQQRTNPARLQVFSRGRTIGAAPVCDDDIHAIGKRSHSIELRQKPRTLVDHENRNTVSLAPG